MIFSRIVPGLSAVVAFLALGSCTYFTGPPDSKGNFKGISYGVDSPPKMLRILAVHGMGKHCIGHSEKLITELTNRMRLVAKPPLSVNGKPMPILAIPEDCDPDPEERLKTDTKLWRVQKDLCEKLMGECKVIEKIFRENGKPFPYGFLRVRDYAKAGDRLEDTRLRFFELTWDSTTRWAKEDYLKVDQGIEVDGQLSGNKFLKDLVVNQGFSDPLLYLGEYQSHVLVPFYEALCWMMIKDPYAFQNGKTAPPDTCDLPRLMELAGNSLLDPQPYFNNEIVLISSSLGSRILYDAVVNMICQKDTDTGRKVLDVFKLWLEKKNKGENKKNDTTQMDEEGRNLRDIRRLRMAMYLFGSRLFGFYMLANQLPLLELKNVQHPRQKPDALFKQTGLKKDYDPSSPCVSDGKQDLRLAAWRGLKRYYFLDRAAFRLDLLDRIETVKKRIVSQEKKLEKTQETLEALNERILGNAEVIKRAKDDVEELNARKEKLKADIGKIIGDAFAQDRKGEQTAVLKSRDIFSLVIGINQAEARKSELQAANEKLEQDSYERLRDVIKAAQEFVEATKALEEDEANLDSLQKTLDHIDERIVELSTPEGEFKVVAISDPNDLLSFEVPAGGILPKAGIINVSANIAKIGYLGLLADPVKAHMGHAGDKDVIELMACGWVGKGEDDENGKVLEPGSFARCAEIK